MPTSKRPERIQRVVKLSRDLVKYHSAFLAGVPRGDRHPPPNADVDLFPNAWPTEKKAKPPTPPFLVPAVIDALRDSPEFGALVKLVPGEADGFCAQHIRRHGGITVTSDSDLLVYDLGKTGAVVFFADIDIDMETQRLIAPQYRPADLCKRLSLKPDTGLQYLAFEVSRDNHLTLEQAVERSKRGEAVSASPGEYSEFIDQYLSPEVASELGAEQVLALDPRVSEIILRSLPTTESATPISASRPASEATALEMYLPFLLDCPSRTSAWEAAKPLRQMAYAMLQPAGGRSIASVSEMRRLQSTSSGLHVDVPEVADVDGLGASLLALLSEIEAGVSQPELVWVVLSVYQDIVMTVDRGRGYPLSLEVLGQATRGKLDTSSWDFLHFLAQSQATHYSLRMLRQVLDFSRQRMGTLSSTLSELTRFMERLPPLADFPSPRTFLTIVLSLKEAGGVSCLQNLCEGYEDIIPLIKAIQRPQNNKKSKKRKSTVPVESSNTRPRSSNPFELLARGGE